MREIRLKSVAKSFGNVRALNGVDLEIREGEILALVGENGAGKSTLMKILSGVIPAGQFEGEIEINGSETLFHSPHDAEAAGIAIIHQELSAFPHLSVAENLFVGHWPTRAGLVDLVAMELAAKALLARIGASSIDPTLPMGQLSTGSQQLVEIAKALGRESKVLILDEPTSSLTPQETGILFKVLKTLKSEGRALVYISHKMEEIFALADQIAILRDGQSVHQGRANELTEANLISMMVGRPLDRLFPIKPETGYAQNEIALHVRDFRARPREGRPLGPLSFELRRGEILGFAGLLGAGRTEIFRAMLGPDSAEISIDGLVARGATERRWTNVRSSLRDGVAIVGEDRKRDSIFPQRPLEENVSLTRLALRGLGRVLSTNEESEKATQSLDALRTRRRDLAQPISDLSGGNQQKIVIARTLQTAPEVLVLDEPTRGVDVGAKYEIYQILFSLASEGRALIVISSDLPELMALSDRIAVMAEGRLTAMLNREEFSQEKIMTAAVATRTDDKGLAL